MKKKILNLLLSFFIFVGFSSLAGVTKEYTDLDSSHWAYDQIESLSNENIVVGYPDGSFRPDENVTRAEFAVMVVKAIGQEDASLKEIISFDDIDQNYWAWDMIQRAVRFDIVKASADNRFHPTESVTRAQAMIFVVNALSTEHITEDRARQALMQTYSDYKHIPEWAIVTAGKAEILGVIAKVPGKEKLIEAEKPATRAELAVFLYNLKEQVKINANKKIKEVQQPKKANGIVIDGVIVTGNTATIPKGTMLPVVVENAVSSQSSGLGEVFVVKTIRNLITKERYLLIPENTPIAGQVLDVKKGAYFLRNGQLVLETKSIKVYDEQVAKFNALADTDKTYEGWWNKFVKTVFKGDKVNFNVGSPLNIMLLQPLKIDLVTGKFIE